MNRGKPGAMSTRPHLSPPMRRTKRCSGCRKHFAAIGPEDMDDDLDAALRDAGAELDEDHRIGRWVCGCSLGRLLTALREGGWEELPGEIAAEAAPALARAKVPRRVWPTQLMRPADPMGDPWVASASWVPEWAARVLEIRMEGMFTRTDGRLWLQPQRLRAALSMWNAEPELVAASMTLYRLQGAEAFARYVLTRGGRIADADLDEA